MEEKGLKLGSSLPAPSVKELVKESLNRIPPRFIHPEQDPPVIFYEIQAPELPIIDMKKLLSQESMHSELERLHFACSEWGFFQLISHGVGNALLDKIKIGIREFFDLPMEKKKKYGQRAGDLEGLGQVFVVSEEQKLDWNDQFGLVTQPVHFRKPHLFPELPLPFRDALDAYSLEVKKLAMAILEKIAIALKMEPEEMHDFFGEEMMQSMRMNFYPPCPEPEKTIGLSPHSDAGGLTILLQVNEMEGLQIRKDGNWVLVKPLPDAFIVNVGDMLEIISNGAYHSIEHRAVVNSIQERLSIATFCIVRYDTKVRPALSLISEQSPALFRSVTAEEYLRGFMASELYGKCYIDSMRINPSEN